MNLALKNPVPPEVDLSPLHRLLSAVRRRMRVVQGLGGFIVSVSVAFGTGFLLFVTDNLFWLPGWLRAAFGVAAASILVGVLVWAVLRPLVRPLRDETVALFTESRIKGLENRLINPLQLSREGLEGWSALFAAEAVKEGMEALRSAGDIDPVDRRPLRRAASILPVPVLAFLLYALLVPGHLANAVERYMRPFAWVNPVSDLSIRVNPGDVRVVSGEPLTLAAEVSGGFPESVLLVLNPGDGAEEFEMPFSGTGYSHTFPRVVRGFSYRAVARGIASARHLVSVVPRPDVRRIDLTLTFPEYAKRPPKVERNADGNIRALAGTQARLEVHSGVSLKAAHLVFEDGPELPMSVEGRSAWCAFPVSRRTAYSILLMSEQDVPNSNGLHYTVEPVPDQPPRVQLTSPGRDLTVAPGQTVRVHFQASDDVGLKAAVLLARGSGEEDAERPVRGWKFSEGMTEASEGHPWDLSAESLKPGDVLVYRVAVYDSNPASRGATSPPYRIRVESPEQKKEDLEKQLGDLVAWLKRLVRAQRMVRAQTEKAAKTLTRAKAFKAEKARSGLGKITESQEKLGAEAVRMSGAVKGTSPFESRVREALTALSADEFPRAHGQLRAALQEQDFRRWPEYLRAASATQEEIVKTLQDLLDRSQAMLEQVKSLPADEALKAPEEPLSRQDLLEKAKETLQEFLKTQKEVIEQTEELARKPVEDFTAEDDAKARDLAAIEDKLAELLRDLKDDFSRLPEQDLSDGTMVDEFMEIYVEVELARDALTRKNIELAVPLEQAGAELAEQLTKNLEKYLPDVHDNIRWNMEDPPEDMEVPLADLPEELEDMVGDLIEEANDLAEEVEDVTSAWADSLNEGAGWAVMDGPISNMSAQGKTGNYLPNNQEVGGRSGEGRTGRSSGQMVEKTAQGKGGRQTPFRLTPDAYEKGKVDDRSGDPGGGGTGGGKLSGSGAEGLRGPCPPQLASELDRLQGRTVEIREKAEKLDARLRAHRYPAEQVGEAVLLIEQMADSLRRGQTTRFAAQQKRLLEQLGEARSVIGGNLQLSREAASRVPKRLREELNNVAKEKMPEAYRELLRRYYKVLAEGKKSE